MNGTGPPENASAAEPIELRRAVKALLDVEYRQSPAVAVGRKRVELAGAAVIAVAVAEFPPLDLPFDHGPSFTHRKIPNQNLSRPGMMESIWD
jgi:hypothetical protein